jgi:heterotetrameric sarcosine oxidase gamma subunit
MAERASPFAATVAESRAGIRLSALAPGSIWQVACWADTFDEVAGDLASALGCDAPAPGRAAPAADERLLIRVEPLKWWVIGPDGADCPLTLDPDRGATLDMSHDQAGIAVEGAEAAELLKRLVSIDLRERAFPDLAWATTLAHHMITRLLRRDRGTSCYEVMVMRSYADDLHGLLAHHLAQYG